MSISTASSRLFKILLFENLKRDGSCICYRCQKKINSPEDLSIDHKIPWMYKNNAIDLFFDLKNIAFSHRSCNSSDRRCPFTVRSSTGFKGVYKNNQASKNSKKFFACISQNNVRYRLGKYHTAKEAAMAYDKAAVRAFGEKAVTNKSLGLI